LKNSRNAYSKLEKCLAAYLLALEDGSPLHSTRELAEMYDVSLGSISSALNKLEDIGAVEIKRRGRLGSFLERKSIGGLWEVAEGSPMVVALTLPSFPRCEGLATAIFSLLNGAEIKTYLIFIRGSLNRIQALRKGQCHAAIMSELAADELCGRGEEVILGLPPQSFVADHLVLYRRTKKGSRHPVTVGVDTDSFDIKYITELEFAGEDVEFQQMPFTQFDLHLEESAVDAAITNSDFSERLMSQEIAFRPLSPEVQEHIGNRDTSAVVVTKSAAHLVKNVLKEVLNPDRIVEIQQKVMDGLMVPRY
jgi:DNA-binding transcriptional ArsR family regulator